MTNKNLDLLVAKLGNYVEKNYSEMTDKNHSVLRSTVVIFARAAGTGTQTLKQVAKAYGLPVTTWHETLDKIVAATEARGSTAADTIKKTIERTKELDQKFDTLGLPKHGFVAGIKKIGLAKKGL